MSDPKADTAIMHPTSLGDLQQCAVMIRTWIPEVYPANSNGQVPFARAVMESVADTIDRVLQDEAAYRATADEIHQCYLAAHSRAHTLNEHVGHIWRASVYDSGKLEDVINGELSAAILNAASAAGYIKADGSMPVTQGGAA
jgi:hypothetical protein